MLVFRCSKCQGEVECWMFASLPPVTQYRCRVCGETKTEKADRQEFVVEMGE